MAFKVGIMVDLRMPYIYMLMPLSMTLMQGHRVSKGKKISFELSKKNRKRMTASIQANKSDTQKVKNESFLTSTKQNNLYCCGRPCEFEKKLRNARRLQQR